MNVGPSSAPPPKYGELRWANWGRKRGPRLFQNPRFGDYQTDEEWCFIPIAREGISEFARQSWSDSRGISTRGGLVLGSVGVAIQGASYDLADVDLVR